MARNQIIINVDVGETRVALIEDGIVTELHIERKGERSNVGDVYLGRVTRVLPGMNAAFVDIGLERAAFLHSEDVVAEQRLRDTTVFSDADADDDAPPKPTGRSAPRSERNVRADRAAPSERHAPARVRTEVPLERSRTNSSNEELVREPADVAALAIPSEVREPDGLPADEMPADEMPADEMPADEMPADEMPADEMPADEMPADEMSLEQSEFAEEAFAPTSESEEIADDDLPSEQFEADEESAGLGDMLSDTGVGTTGANSGVGNDKPGPSRDRSQHQGRNGRSGRDQRGQPRGQSGGQQRSGQNNNQNSNNQGGRRNAQRGAPSRDNRGGGTAPSSRDSRDKRITTGGGTGGGARHERTTRQPIRDLLREGQEIVVQVSKDPLGTKGARCTSHISLAGRHSVYLPTVEHVGVSKRIGNEKERRRLREVIEQLKPEKGGIIVRTASEGLTKKGLKTDVAYLVTLWNEIWRKREAAKGATLLYSELDVVLRTVRDVMGPEIEKVVIDDREAHARCQRFVERFMPERKDDIMLYSGDEPLFDAYGIEDEISRALARKVPLRSGGYLILDQAEALTAIDVNSGRFVGQKDVEDTVTQTNLEAVEEIAYQLRLRNLGGLIILDLIDMDRQGNRDKVYKLLAESLNKDKAKTSILRISELGLIEMTRKRTRESLGRQLYEPCFYCDGTGHTSSRQTIAYEVLRQIRREKDDLKGYTIVINAHPAVADALRHEAKEAFEEAQRRYQRRFVVMSKPEYHIEQFDLTGQ